MTKDFDFGSCQERFGLYWTVVAKDVFKRLVNGLATKNHDVPPVSVANLMKPFKPYKPCKRLKNFGLKKPWDPFWLQESLKKIIQI
jgi:hypothetical protein